MSVKLPLLLSAGFLGISLITLFVGICLRTCGIPTPTATKTETTLISSVTEDEGYKLLDPQKISPAYQILVNAFRDDFIFDNSSFPKIWSPLEIPEFEIEKFLGRGAFGVVWLAKMAPQGEKVALKFMTKFSNVDLSLLTDKNLKNEILINSLVGKRSFFPTFHGYFKFSDLGKEMQGFDKTNLSHTAADKILVVVQEFVEGFTLDDHKWDLEEMRQITLQLIVGLFYMQSNGLVHRDLKPENIIFNPNENRLVILDLGLSKQRENPILSVDEFESRHQKWLSEGFFAKKDEKQSICGTPSFFSWEICQRKASYEADMYAAGSTIANVLFNSFSIACFFDFPMRYRVLGAKLMQNRQLRDFFPVIMSLRHPHPGGRNSLGAVMACDLFSDEDWKGIKQKGWGK